jgi:hypothetical protein
MEASVIGPVASQPNPRGKPLTANLPMISGRAAILIIAVVTGLGAWEPSFRGFGIAKILKKRQLHLRQGCHPVDAG